MSCDEVRAMALEDANNSITFDKLLRRGYNTADFRGVEEFIFLVGSTGCGKSTLLKFLCRDPSLTIILNKQFDYIFSDEEGIIGSKCSFTSKTLQPNFKKDELTGTFIVDCAGFEDTRSALEDLVAAFVNKLIFDSAKKLKIVVVENFNKLKLNEDRNAFKNALKYVSNLVGDNYKAINGSLGLIATKVDSTKSNKLLKLSIKTYLIETLKYLKNDAQHSEIQEEINWQIELTQHLLDGKKFAIFRRPAESGDPWNSKPLSTNFDKMRKLLFKKMSFTSGALKKFQVTVAPATINYIIQRARPETFVAAEELAITTNKTVLDQLERKLNSACKFVVEKAERNLNICSKMLDELQSINNHESLINFYRNKQINYAVINELNYECKKLVFFYELAKDSIEDLNSQIVNWIKPIISDVKKSIDFYHFLFTVNVDLDSYEVRLHNDRTRNTFQGLSIDNHKNMLLKLSLCGFSQNLAVSAQTITYKEDYIQDLKNLFLEKTQPPVQISKFENSVTCQGRFVIASQHLESIMAQNPQEVILMASERVYIDCDMNFQNTHLTLFAPYLEIIHGVALRKIRLQGDDGMPFAEPKASDAISHTEDGYRGANGNPGYSSGSLRIYALEIINCKFLHVFTKGGNGSNGQDGGDGKSGKNSTLTPVEVAPHWTEEDQLHGVASTACCKVEEVNVVKSFMWSRIYTIFTLYVPYSVQREVHITKLGNEPPTNGGRGGDAGLGAIPGAMDFFIKDQNIRINFVSQPGTNGKPGRGGKAGVNCSNGKYQKIQVESKIHTFILPFNVRKIYSDMYRFTPKDYGELTSAYNPVTFGSDGEVYETVIIDSYRYKYPRITSMFDVLLLFSERSIKDTVELREEHGTHQFMRFVATSDAFVANRNEFDYGEFQARVSKIAGVSPSRNAKCVYDAMKHSIKKFMKCKKVDINYCTKLLSKFYEK